MIMVALHMKNSCRVWKKGETLLFLHWKVEADYQYMHWLHVVELTE